MLSNNKKKMKLKSSKVENVEIKVIFYILLEKS